MGYFAEGRRSTYSVEESEQAGGVQLQCVRVADFAGVLGLGVASLECDGDRQSSGLVVREIGGFDRLPGLLWRSGSSGSRRLLLAGSLLFRCSGHFGFNLGLLP
jgi:hypothetical protein